MVWGDIIGTRNRITVTMEYGQSKKSYEGGWVSVTMVMGLYLTVRRCAMMVT